MTWLDGFRKKKENFLYINPRTNRKQNLDPGDFHLGKKEAQLCSNDKNFCISENKGHGSTFVSNFPNRNVISLFGENTSSLFFQIVS